MGLDWNPGNKPRPGYEAEFRELFEALEEAGEGRELEKRFYEISTSAAETLGAPVVGQDESANVWAREMYECNRPEVPLDEWLSDLKGFFVLPLVPPCDGLPRYTNGSPGGYVEQYAFRAQFLVRCEAIVGADLIEQAYQSKLPSELLAYGRALRERAESYAASNGIDVAAMDTDDTDGDGFRLDVVLAASRWCVFWARRGHMLEAYW